MTQRDYEDLLLIYDAWRRLDTELLNITDGKYTPFLGEGFGDISRIESIIMRRSPLYREDEDCESGAFWKVLNDNTSTVQERTQLLFLTH